MDRALVKRSRVKLPAGLAPLFNDPPLVGNEKPEDYDNFFSEIVAAVNPSDAIGWLLARDVADLSWEIQRERRLKLQVIKSAQTDVVRRLLTPPKRYADDWMNVYEVDPNAEKIAKEAKQWASDPKARRRIDKELAEKGCDVSNILTTALSSAADHIDAIDRRIASYELRRMAALRATEQYSEKLARRLEAASTDVIEGQFTEAAE
jgi:hypothetical protein